MATTTLAPAPRERFFNAFTLAPLSGGYLYTFTAGTQSPLTTYQDAAGLTPNSNPIVLDPTGSAVVYLTLGQSYKFIWTDGSAAFPQVATAIVGVVQGSQDNILAVPPAAAAFDLTGTAAVTIMANQAAYLSDGSGSLIAGQWYLADASKIYSSSANLIGIATSTISAGMTGSFRVAGQLGGFAGLVAGSLYYVGTAGALQTTAGSFARLVGQADSTTDLVIFADPPIAANQTIDTGICNGRLTLTSGLAVPSADVTGSTVVYFTPYAGNRIALYDGISTWSLFTFAETTLQIGIVGSGLPIDVFAYNNNGVLGLNLIGWTNGTTRATALTLQDAVLVSTGATGHRYLGTFYTTSTTTTEDSAANRFVWNYYNRQRRRLMRTESNGANSWNYTTATVRQANANVLNKVQVIIGAAEVVVDLRLNVTVANATGGATSHVHVGFGADSITVLDQGSALGGEADCTLAGALVNLAATANYQPTVGYHYYAWLEWAAAVGTVTWNTNDGTFQAGNGLQGWIDG